MKHIRFLALFLASAPFFALGAAEITVPRMEMASAGRVNDDGKFDLSTSALVDIALDGGYKYGILLGLSFTADNLGKALAYRDFSFQPLPQGQGTPVTVAEYNSLVDGANRMLDNQAILSFRIARATAREFLDLPLELSYFVGYADAFCSGEEFVSRYGLYQIPTEFTGFYYFPEGIGGDITRFYKGIYGVKGTGFSFALTPWERFVPMLYLYQDLPALDKTGLSFAESRYSGDLRMIFNLEGLALEFFAGISGRTVSDLRFRGGVLACFSSGKGADLFLQAGIPGLQRGSALGVDNLYFLIEPRLSFGDFALHVSFFYHPLIYGDIESEDERGRADVNIKFIAGDPLRTGIQGGIETTLNLKVEKQEDMKFWLSPFISLLSGGLRWNFKLRMNPIEYRTPSKMFEVFAGIQAAY
jgi:hypothetical protein